MAFIHFTRVKTRAGILIGVGVQAEAGGHSYRAYPIISDRPLRLGELAAYGWSAGTAHDARKEAANHVDAARVAS